MGLQLGSIAPDFEQESTAGRVRFYDWAGDSWVVLFSHPKGFTPVCTAELGYVAEVKPEFDRRGKDGDEVVIVPSQQAPKVIAEKFPKGFKAVRPYLRLTPQPNK